MFLYSNRAKPYLELKKLRRVDEPSRFVAVASVTTQCKSPRGVETALAAFSVTASHVSRDRPSLPSHRSIAPRRGQPEDRDVCICL